MSTNYFDAHCDTASALWKKSEELAYNSGPVSLEKAAKLTRYGQVFAICGDKQRGEKALQNHFKNIYLYITRQFEKNKSKIRLCKSADDIKKAQQEKKAAALLSVEGCEQLPLGPDGISEAYHMGFRLFGLVWENDNRLACSCAGSGEGLTPEGAAVVIACDTMPVLLDVSHLSEKGFYELCTISTKPIIATHSDAYTVCSHPRNLTDAQIIEIAARKGVCGINLYTHFLNHTAAAGTEDVLRHIEHICELAGSDCLCIGADYDGCESLPNDLDGIDRIALLAEALDRRGYTSEIIDGILYNNFAKVLLENL